MLIAICGHIPRRDQTDPDDLLRRADEKLYQAKRAGGNRVAG